MSQLMCALCRNSDLVLARVHQDRGARRRWAPRTFPAASAEAGHAVDARRLNRGEYVHIAARVDSVVAVGVNRGDAGDSVCDVPHLTRRAPVRLLPAPLRACPEGTQRIFTTASRSPSVSWAQGTGQPCDRHDHPGSHPAAHQEYPRGTPVQRSSFFSSRLLTPPRGPPALDVADRRPCNPVRSATICWENPRYPGPRGTACQAATPLRLRTCRLLESTRSCLPSSVDSVHDRLSKGEHRPR